MSYFDEYEPPVTVIAYSNRPVAQLFPHAAIRAKNGKCTTCDSIIEQQKFRDSLSKREHGISGTCQKCQDEVFGVDNNCLFDCPEDDEDENACDD